MMTTAGITIVEMTARGQSFFVEAKINNPLTTSLRFQTMLNHINSSYPRTLYAAIATAISKGNC